MHFFSREKERLKFKRKIWTITAVTMATSAAAVIAFCVFNAYFRVHAWQMWLSLTALAAVFVGAAVIFKKIVYDPIKKLERAMEAVADVDNIMAFEIEVDEQNELYGLASLLNRMMYKLKDYATREYSAVLLAKQAEINALQTQINPHFLYNTLDSIRGLALTEGQKNIATMTKALSGIFRYSISKKEHLSTLREEIKNAADYMTIQQLRFPDKFIFITDIDVAADPDIMEYSLPKLTIQPIVENSVFHGLETKMGTGTIVLHAYITERRLIISIEDDGIGIEQDVLNRINEGLTQKIEASSEGTSNIALMNVNERIKLFFGERYGIKMISTQNVGTTVLISLPLVK